MEFSQLPELRRRAEGWRNGLAGLTTLLAVLAVLKGRDNLADLPPSARTLAMLLLAGAFTLLLIGTLLAIRASHGRPGEEIVLGGQTLRRWTEREVERAGRALWAASACCVLGILSAGLAVGVAWSLSAPSGAPETVKVRTSKSSLCGELVGAGQDGLSLWTGSGNRKQLRTLPLGEVVSVVPTKSCP
ncbi:hypothetical protein [Streptomyces pakalii]|uniref:Uncharacterized protein n=1 Tax=Streptomyces pakalii TaxID=3036494 RepID=A0ABT7DGA8_9ACTN|nr:hypothetical protein [Streptomyces pakalii]MDJ1644866.1 hypothetical protein [Streptomyces pakalii]